MELDDRDFEGIEGAIYQTLEKDLEGIDAKIKSAKKRLKNYKKKKKAWKKFLKKRSQKVEATDKEGLRELSIRIRVNQSELDKARIVAEAQGKTVSAYLRDMVLFHYESCSPEAIKQLGYAS